MCHSDYYEVHTMSLQTFFVWEFRIVIDSWKFSMLLLYILWDDWPIFMISGLNEQLQQQLEYRLLKPDCHSWWISKMQSGREEERYAIKFNILLLYILWDDWPIFMISGSNQQLQHELEYTLLKPDCHSWWISKMQSGREDSLEDRYAIKLCFKLGKNATETYGMLQTVFRPSCMNRASVSGWHKRFKKGKESVRDD